MQWENWSAFWSMGGYGVYVWGSYVVCALCIGIEILLVRKAASQLKKQLNSQVNRSL